MKFSQVVAQTIAWLQREGRVSYRTLKLEFNLNDDVLDALKDELIDAKRLATDENGKVLVWTGSSSPASGVQSPELKQVQGLKPVLPAPVPQAQVSVVEGSKGKSQKKK